MKLMKTIKTPLIQCVTIILCAVTLIACSESNRTKNVRNAPKSGSKAAPAPTPTTGLNAAGYMALNTISLKQVVRAFDLATRQHDSVYLHACQTLVATQDGDMVKVKIVTPEESCPQESRGRSAQNRTTWIADETFEITYTDSSRKAIKKIEKRPGMQIMGKKTKDGRPVVEFNIGGETISFTRPTETANYYLFKYESTLRLETTETRRARNNERRPRTASGLRAKNNDASRPEANSQDKELETDVNPTTDGLADGTANTVTQINFKAEGTFNFETQSDEAWAITENSIEYKRSRNQRAEIANLTFDMATGANTENLALVCGMPIGVFEIIQSVQSDNKRGDYKPKVVIDRDGSIAVPSARDRMASKTCTDEGLKGFTDLFATIEAAEQLTKRTHKLSSIDLQESIEAPSVR